jgi:hypothetical protein
MAIANSYPMGTPKSDDLLLGTSVPSPGTNEKATTRNFSLSQVGTLVNTVNLGYTNYVALITQTGTNAPSADPLIQNTTGGTPVFAYVSPGVYTITFPFAFKADPNVVVFINNGNASPTANVGWALTGVAGQIRINATGNGVLTRGSLEIRIYA